ncbi:hypothetical protein Tco_0064136 [Tanacetum coccineum]
MKESHFKEVEMTKMVKVKENALDVEIRIISSENVQSRQEAIIKLLLLEEHGVIVAKMRKKRLKTKLSLNVTFDETPPPSKTSPLEDDDLVEQEAIEVPRYPSHPVGYEQTDSNHVKIRIHRYIRGKPNGKLIWKSIQNGPTPHPMVTDPPPANSTVMPAPRKKLDSEFNVEENKLEMADTPG